MATIHHTTMTPTKLELLAGWLPKQNWYRGDGTPDPVRAGGFRLDDPAGEVGIEIMVVADAAAPEPTAYLVPLAYRGAPLAGAPGEALIGTSEHGVLGTRWIYDGVHDPVVMERLGALLRGEAEPQQQSRSDTPDPTVVVRGSGPGDGAIRINRVLRPEDAAEENAGGTPRCVVAGWTGSDGVPVRGVFATVAP